MGRKKNRTIQTKEKFQPSRTANSSVTARNINKSDLSGVIFGCKNYTIQECHIKQLFGLPAPHFSYVRNISPGMPLFLFNYSDRKLYGTYEAASIGQMNIDPHGWTDGSESTPYPAQVRVRICRPCQPLVEDQFKPILAQNYYEASLFWFELNKSQTSKLMAMFSSSPSLEVLPWGRTLPIPFAREKGKNTEKPALGMKCSQSNLELGSSWDSCGWEVESQQEFVHLEPSTSLPRKKWSSLFKPSSVESNGVETSTSDGKTWSSLFRTPTFGSKGIETQSSDVNYPHLDDNNMEGEAPSDAPWLDKEIDHLESLRITDVSEASTYEEATEENDEERQALGAPADKNASEASANEHLEQDCECFYGEANEVHAKDGCYWKASTDEEATIEDGENRQALEAPADEDTTEINENEHLEEECEYPYRENSDVCSEDTCSSEGEEGLKLISPDFQLKSPDLQSFIAKLVQEMEGLKSSHLQQFQRVNSLEKELVASKKKIKWLEDRCEMMESGAIVDVENTEPELMNSNHTESILVVGGFDGSSYLSSLHSYSPFKDEMKPLCSMSIVRSYASAVKLSGELYILGGGDGSDVWYSSVQSYDGLSNQWISRPSLNQKKGNLAGTCVYNKIFSIGGANALECLSDVEVLDLEVGKWICTQPMLQKRSAPAATEINGMIYAVGGYCGSYLKSVERLDPREKSWTTLESMNSRRGCHSLVALNEKLYAIGGYDGSTMVRTVEVFDPRIGSWVMGESMIASRGYSAAVVIGTAIYVIGGANNAGFVNTVECYKEGGVWEVTNLKAFGQRSFFSAIAL